MTKRQSFKKDWQDIWNSKALVSGERGFGLFIRCLKQLVPSEWLLIISRWRGIDERWDYRIVDVYVCVTTLFLLIILLWLDWPPELSASIAGFVLAGTIINQANVVFLSKVFGAPRSIERTLLLFFFNAAQVVLTFAILYRWKLPTLSAGKAITYAIQVFGTLDYPKSDAVDVIVNVQVAVDLFLFAIFLAFIVGNLGRPVRK